LGKANKLIVIAGATASGKTKKAIELAQKLNCEIFSADSRQIYKELNIGVAKPSLEELNSIKHHFIDHISIYDHYDGGTFEFEVLSALESYFHHNDTAILVGGTGFYIRAVTHGLDAFPPINSTVTEELDRIFNEKGLDPLVELLREKDFTTYNEIDLANQRRVIRALAVTLSSGVPFSQFKSGLHKNRPFDIYYLYMDVDRVELYERINARVDKMIDNGLQEEVAGLRQAFHLKALDTVGYKEFIPFFAGEEKLQVVVDKIKQNTRNYAKRQMTFFRAYQKSEKIILFKE
jgi:tRNA dimethylallyltransferase